MNRHSIGDCFEAVCCVANGVADVGGFDHIDIVVIVSDTDECVTAELFLEPSCGSALAVGGIVEFDSEFPASRDVELAAEDAFDLGVGFVGVAVVHNRDHLYEWSGEGVDELAARLGGIVFVKGVNSRAADGVDVEAFNGVAMIVCRESLEHLLLGYKTLIEDLFSVDRNDHRAVVGDYRRIRLDDACGTLGEHFVISSAGEGEVSSLGLKICNGVDIFLGKLTVNIDRSVKIGADKVSVKFSHIIKIPLLLKLVGEAIDDVLGVCELIDDPVRLDGCGGRIVG